MPYSDNASQAYLPAMGPRPWGLFTSVVPEIKVLDTNGQDRLAFGAKFMAPAAYSPIVVDYSCESEDDKSGNLGLTPEVTSAFLTFNLLSCSTLSGDVGDLVAYTEEAFNATISEALAYAATTAISADHLNLFDDSTLLPAGGTMLECIEIIEQGLAERISNQQGYILIPVRYLATALSYGVIHFNGGQLVSPAGHLVISDAGHHPLNVVYGTGALGYALSEKMPFQSFDYSVNVLTWMREAYGLILFNPNWSVRTNLTGGVSA